MTNKAMKARHWQRMADTTGHVFEVENESFCLRNIMEAPLLQSKEDIEVRAIGKKLRLISGSQGFINKV